MTDRRTIRVYFENGLDLVAKVPAELQPGPDGGASQLSLVRRMVTSMLADPAHDAISTRLFDTIQQAMQSTSFAEEGMQIADLAFQLLSAILANRQFIDAFDKKSALVTLYFFIVSMMLCAQIDIVNICNHEKQIVQLATLMNRLLLNRQVYETSRAATEYLRRMFRKCVDTRGRCCCGCPATDDDANESPPTLELTAPVLPPPIVPSREGDV